MEEVISPNSSEHVNATPVEEAEPGAFQEKLDALSADEPLPDTYAGDQIVLLVQTPERLFLYWKHGRDPLETARAAFGEAAGGYRLAVRLVDLSDGEVSLYAAPPEREEWLDVLPDREYRAEVGLLAFNRPFIRLLSAVMRTPRAGVAPEPDSLPQFRVSAPEFARVLREAGYAGAARRLARREAAAGDPASREFVGEDFDLEQEFETEDEGRAAWGASDISMRPRRRVLKRRPAWLPSMTTGHLSNDE